MAESLYLVLPSAGPADNDITPWDQYFRLQEISKLRQHLEDERDKRSQLYKKYRRGVSAVDAVDKTLISACMGMGIGGIGLLSTTVAAPVVLGLEVAALGCGLLGVAGSSVGVSWLRPAAWRGQSTGGEQAEHYRWPCFKSTCRWYDFRGRIPPHRWGGPQIYPDEGRDSGRGKNGICRNHYRRGDKKLPNPERPGRGRSQFHDEAGSVLNCTCVCVCLTTGSGDPPPCTC